MSARPRPAQLGCAPHGDLQKLEPVSSRTSAGKYQLDVQEIRAAFLAAETAYDSLRRIRTERVAQVLALETPIQMAEGPKFMLHALACQHRRGGLGAFSQDDRDRAGQRASDARGKRSQLAIQPRRIRPPHPAQGPGRSVLYPGSAPVASRRSAGPCR